MKSIKIVEYTNQEAAILELAQTMRQRDVAEIKLLGYGSPEAALRISLNPNNDCYIAYSEAGEVLCMYGVSRVKREYGYGIWFLGSNLVEQYKREFTILSRDFLRQVIESGKKPLFNFIDVNNKLSIRWLTWLGAKFAEPFPVSSGHARLFVLEEVR